MRTAGDRGEVDRELLLRDDGILAASAESAEFRVPTKAPQVMIKELPNHGVYTSGDDVILDGDAFDLQDDDIKESQLRWSSNGRSLGKGTRSSSHTSAPAITSSSLQ